MCSNTSNRTPNLNIRNLGSILTLDVVSDEFARELIVLRVESGRSCL